MALTDKLTSIANAIRSKGGTTDLLTLGGMVEAINAIETGSGATDVTDSIVSVSFSGTNANDTKDGFRVIIPEDAKVAIFHFQGNLSNASNNQCLLAIFPKMYLKNEMAYIRWRNSSYDFQSTSTSVYDLVVNSGDTFRMVVIR